ncbi:molybdate-anion transporter-like [Neltuma alba]|uniref:molybdate-anion transporter-like n=1 Tax=Neltuma alba TaxID=207710 RepID=UPI0010A3467C|nr:molybdate-anion transporter-like [Prosopis alba]
MAITIESSVWEPNPSIYIFLFFSCCFSIFLFPHFTNSNRTSTVFDHGISSSFLRFQRKFILLYSLSSVMEGLWLAFGEFELASYGVGREQMVMSLCYRFGASLIASPFLGVISDLIGHKKACLFFGILHLFVGIWKRVSEYPSIFVTSICLSLASTIFSFSFESWMVTLHEKQGHRLDSLNDTFWLMAFSEPACFIASQVFANWLVGDNFEKKTAPSTAAIFLATVCITFLSRGWAENPQAISLKDYSVSFYAYILGDKRIWLLGWAQACLYFSIGIFWILWAPTVVADGREVHLGLIYPFFLGSRMLGSTVFPWLTSGRLPIRTEDWLVYAYIILGLVLSIIAYDYQEIGVLVTLFILFHACVGLILPSLARLRTMYVPNELRGGMMGLSLAPANAAMLLSLVEGGYYRNVGNAALMAFGVLGLLTSAGCMHALKQWGKQPYNNWHKQ